MSFKSDIDMTDIEHLYQEAATKEELLEVKINRVLKWSNDRNIIGGSSLLAQYAKCQSEMGELADAILKGNKDEFEDAMGDAIVVLINLCAIANTSIGTCLDRAWEQIKDRKGVMFQGAFIKESDENYSRIKNIVSTQKANLEVAK